ncbi:MAG: GTPase ObgE [Candidatus Omnitrophota bacterium]
MLIDYAKIYVAGGKGGKGCQSLFRDMFHRRGIPDGGDGGGGGDVVIISDPNLSTLLDFRYNQHYQAEKGAHGGSNHKYGRRGKDLIVKVPVGTIIKDAETGMIMRDLCEEAEQVIAARGGAGGKGNAKRAVATEGAPGETRTLLLELKLVADAGFIGFPNAGKSTLISRISKAHSKIAPYPFTTKSPKLGVVRFGDDSFVAADMPGLIEGAHEGKGLGDRFLRHIERTLVLVHIVDITPFDGTEPADRFFQLEQELELYNRDVYLKPRIIVANKMDMPGAEENLKAFKKKVKKSKNEIFAISALSGEGVQQLIGAIYKKVKDAKEKTEEDNGKSWY